jgi:BolA family transcriptional regulator, general stress-responsive regulator
MGMRVADIIRDKLTAEFQPSTLIVQDDSARHAGHSGAVREDGSQGETHFTVRIVSDKFAGLSRVERQRRVYDVLARELSDRVHALSLTALSPAETRPG